MKKKVFCIMGKSASGKDTIYNLIKNSFTNLSPVITYTTRPMRDGEIQDETYHFISMEEMNILEENGELIERRDYDTVNGLWSYGTGVKCFKNDTDYILITTPAAYRKMKEKLENIELIPIYIEVDDDLRLIRSIERERKNKRKNYEEICRRFLADSEDFSEEILKELEINNRFNNNEECLKDVEEFIKLKISEFDEELGNWILLTDCVGDGVYCSNCSKKVFKTKYANQKLLSNYCPNCGKKMKKGIKKL